MHRQTKNLKKRAGNRILGNSQLEGVGTGTQRKEEVAIHHVKGQSGKLRRIVANRKGVQCCTKEARWGWIKSSTCWQCGHRGTHSFNHMYVVNIRNLGMYDGNTETHMLSSRGLHCSGSYEETTSVQCVSFKNTWYLWISIFTVLSFGAVLKPVSSRPFCLGSLQWQGNSLENMALPAAGNVNFWGEKSHRSHFRWLGLTMTRP